MSGTIPVRGIASALALMLAPPLAAQELPTAEDGYDQQLVPVAPHVWAFVQPGFQLQPVGNVTIVEQSDGVVLIDSGGSPGAGRRLVAQVRALTPKPVKAVVITHWHGDHPLGLSEILKAWPQARTIATRATKAHLETPATMNTSATPDPAANAAYLDRIRGMHGYVAKMLEAATTGAERAGWARTQRMLNQYVRDSDGAVTLSTRETFADRLVLRDRAVPVELRFLGRANTDGDAVVWLPKQRVLVAGDIVVSPVPYGFGSYPRDWIDVLGKLKAYDFAILVPGHGEPMRDAAYLERLAALLAEVRRQVGPLAAEGATLKDAQGRVDLSAQSRAFTGGDAWRERWFGQYWTQPIVASAMKEAKGEPIVQGLGG